VYWPVSSGVVSARHYPELFAASEVRNELITVPAVGITHSRQTTVTAMRTDQPARVGGTTGRRPRKATLATRRHRSRMTFPAARR
jgi:hypothetical protein